MRWPKTTGFVFKIYYYFAILPFLVFCKAPSMGMTSRIPAIIVSQIEELPIYQITILRLHNRNKNKLHAELNEL